MLSSLFFIVLNLAIVWRSVPVYCPGLLSRPYLCKCCTYTGFMAVGSLGFIEDVNTGVEHNFRSHTNRNSIKEMQNQKVTKRYLARHRTEQFGLPEEYANQRVEDIG
jgi:hypothetical protein